MYKFYMDPPSTYIFDLYLLFYYAKMFLKHGSPVGCVSINSHFIGRLALPSYV